MIKNHSITGKFVNKFNFTTKLLSFRLLLFPILLLLLTVIIANSNDLIAQNSVRYIKNEAFGFGEKLEYKVGIISGVLSGLGGSGGISIKKEPKKVKIPSGETRNCYEINFWVDSEGIVDMTYPVHDRYRTVVDVDGIFPYEFNQRIREGNYKRDFNARFDQAKNVAIVNGKEYKIEEYMQDILSALYFARTMDLSGKKRGDVIELKNFYKDSIFALPVKIIKREVVKVPAGKFKTILVQPEVEAGGLFKFINSISIWLTDDERKIPVKVATSIIVGEVGAELEHYSGVRGKINAKIE